MLHFRGVLIICFMTDHNRNERILISYPLKGVYFHIYLRTFFLPSQTYTKKRFRTSHKKAKTIICVLPPAISCYVWIPPWKVHSDHLHMCFCSFPGTSHIHREQTTIYVSRIITGSKLLFKLRGKHQHLVGFVLFPKWNSSCKAAVAIQHLQGP